tara:strand:- start:313 stop:642 length:330 start_codon:yes stop_codon:yes gene_type:complete
MQEGNCAGGVIVPLQDSSRISGTSLMGWLGEVTSREVEEFAKRRGLTLIESNDHDRGYFEEYDCEIDGKPFSVYDRFGRWRFGCHPEDQAAVAWALMNEGFSVSIRQQS